MKFMVKISDNSLNSSYGHQDKTFKNILLPVDAIVLYKERNNYETAQGFHFAS